MLKFSEIKPGNAFFLKGDMDYAIFIKLDHDTINCINTDNWTPQYIHGNTLVMLVDHEVIDVDSDITWTYERECKGN